MHFQIVFHGRKKSFEVLEWYVREFFAQAVLESFIDKKNVIQDYFSTI